MREAVVVSSSRTPLAKSFRGSFNMTRPDDLAAHCIKDALGKVPQLDVAEVEDAILGCAQPNGAQGNNVARIALVRAGLPVSIAGTTDRPDGSTYHITWSLAPGRRAKESNDVIRAHGWTPIELPMPVRLLPARF